MERKEQEGKRVMQIVNRVAGRGGSSQTVSKGQTFATGGKWQSLLYERLVATHLFFYDAGCFAGSLNSLVERFLSNCKHWVLVHGGNGILMDVTQGCVFEPSLLIVYTADMFSNVIESESEWAARPALW